MKGLILAAGKGARMKGIEHSKCLGLVDNKSLISHNVERLLAMGITDIIIVVGKDNSSVKSNVEGYKSKANVMFVEQETPLGIVSAIKCSTQFIGNEDFALCLGDEIFYKQKPVEMFEYFNSIGADCVCGIVSNESENEIKKCYSVLVDESNTIIKLEEKPKRPFNAIKGTGFCIFKNKALDYIDLVEPSKKSGQYELCDWIRLCILKGLICKVFDFADKEFNVNTLADLQQANEFLQSGNRGVCQ